MVKFHFPPFNKPMIFEIKLMSVVCVFLFSNFSKIKQAITIMSTFLKRLFAFGLVSILLMLIFPNGLHIRSGIYCTKAEDFYNNYYFYMSC